MDRGIWRVDSVPLNPAPAGFFSRHWRLIVHILLRVADATLIYGGFALAYWMRYVQEWGRDVPLDFFKELSDFRPIIIALIVLLLLLFEIKGLYRRLRYVNWLDQVGTIVSATTTGIALLVVGIFIYQTFFWSRLIFIYAWINIIILLSLFRLLVRFIVRWAWSRGMGVERVLVVGATGMAQQVMSALAFDIDGPRGARLMGYLDDPEERLASQKPPGKRYTCLGSLDDLEQVVRSYTIDRVIIALPFWAHHRLPSLLSTCRRMGVNFTLAPDLYEISFDGVDIDTVSGIPLLTLNKNIIRGWNLALKRALDLGLVALFAPLWLPLWVLCALLIKLSDPRAPVLFSQERVGKNGARFKVYKFRTMVPNAEELKRQLLAQNEADGPIFKIKNDPRVTHIGKILRKASLDELPQLINVIRGEMSLVGPRPAIPEEVAQYNAWHMRRLEVTPGLTGLWQVLGRSNTSFDEMVRFDIYYTEHWSLWLDLRILLMTIPAVLSGRGAY